MGLADVRLVNYSIAPLWRNEQRKGPIAGVFTRLNKQEDHGLQRRRAADICIACFRWS
jgi:hypothetical protein